MTRALIARPGQLAFGSLLFGRVGLRHKADGAAIGAKELSFAQVVGARQHDARGRVVGCHVTRELDAVHLAQHEVYHHDVDGVKLQVLDRRSRAANRVHLESVRHERARENARCSEVIVDY